ncbi:MULTISPECIES: N-acetyltransferase [unclassified Microbacterium]|nr:MULTISPECIES: N-acetyltransferase [unclassified Microbacterium]MCR2809215.1 N-acetyltransferase [Microbacterium sp. zg.B185]WIM20362.1 N-acetyltransferase [Microbacterium sp. zg-B185]
MRDDQSGPEQGVRITMLCPVVRVFIAEHPEYSDLVDPDPPDF